MKRTIFLSFLIYLAKSIHSQLSLKEKLWERVNSCYSSFEDGAERIIDDSANGYLSISGMTSPCGCECSSTVGAYKHSDGSYTLMEYDESSCNWIGKLSSDKNLKSVLPENFGITTFIPTYQEDPATVNAVFIMVADIPQFGTDTKLSLRLIPFGLSGNTNEIITYGYSEDRNVYPSCITSIQDIASSIKDENTLNLLLQGVYDKINPPDKKIIDAAITKNTKNANEIGSFKSKSDLLKHLRVLKRKYDLYLLVEYTCVILGWDKDKGRFYLKEKNSRFNKVSFKGFLTVNEYWCYRC